MPTNLDTFAPFDAGAGSAVTEATWRKFMTHMLGSASGIIRGFANEFVPSAAGTGMTVTVGTGECWIRGHYGESTSLKTLSIAAAHATLPRIDRIILRADFTNNRVELDIKTGTAAASPVAVALTQTTTVWETSIGLVSIPAADTVIAANQVTDDRQYTTVQAKYTNSIQVQIGPSTFVRVWYDTVVSRSGDIAFDDPNNVFTLNRAGLWILSASVRFQSSTAIPSKREIIIADPADVSGATCTNILASSSSAGSSGEELQLSCTTIDRFSAGKQVAVFAFQSTGSNLYILSLAAQPNFSAVWVGP